MTKRNRKKLNGKPPFYWPLILMVVIVVEGAFLIKERAWSQTYGVNVLKLRDQAEKITFENKLISLKIYSMYEIVSKLQNNSTTLVFSEPKRELIIQTKTQSEIVGISNAGLKRY